MPIFLLVFPIVSRSRQSIQCECKKSCLSNYGSTVSAGPVPVPQFRSHDFWRYINLYVASSALTLLVGRQGGHLACKKTVWWGDLHMFQLMPLPLTVSCFSKIQIGFTFLLSAHLGSPGQRAVKGVCMCACVYKFVCMYVYMPAMH